MKKLLTLVMLLGLYICASAQLPEPVKWRASAKMTSKTEGVVTIKATVQQGWHIYGTDIPEGGPKATSFDFTTTGIKFLNKLTPSVAPVSNYDSQFGINVSWWDSNVSFTRRFRKTGDSQSIAVSVTYMSCNDQTCMPPRTEKLTVKITPYTK